MRDKNERKGRNPQTGEEILLDARRVLTFKPSLVLKNLLNDEPPPAVSFARRLFMSPAALDAEFEEAPERFTPWFREEWQELKGRYRDQLERYCTLD